MPQNTGILHPVLGFREAGSWRRTVSAYLFEMFFVSLILTILLELAVVFLCTWMCAWEERKDRICRSAGQRCHAHLLPAVCGKRGVLLVVLVNVLTNPPAVLLCWLARLYMPDAAGMKGGLLLFFCQFMVEAAVVAVEACVYRSFAREPQWGIRRPVLLSFMANLCSWLGGMILQAVLNM